jgi:hypothetical protein
MSPPLGLGLGLDTALLGVANALPVITNNKYIIVSDSRGANNSETASLYSVRQNASRGFLGWLAVAIGNAGECVGNFGINTDTIQGAATRRTAQGIATGSSPTWRAEYAVNEPAKSAATAIFLIGVNNTTETVDVFGPRIDALFSAEFDGGRQFILACNDLPNNDGGTSGIQNLARRDYYDRWPDSSPALTSAQKASYRRKYRVANTWDSVAASPRSTSSAAGLYGSGDPLHPDGPGNRLIGPVIGAIYAQVLAKNGFFPRNTFPAVGASDATQSILGAALTDITSTTAITATNGESAGAGGANKDGNGGVGVSGVLPNASGVSGRSVAFARSANLQTALNGTQDGSAQLSVVVSTVPWNGRNALRLTLGTNGVLLPATGTLQLILTYSLLVNQATIQTYGLNSRSMSTLARIAFGENANWLKACGVYQNIQNTGGPYNPGANFSLSDGANMASSLSGIAFDGAPMTLTPLVLPSNFDSTAGTYTLQGAVRVSLANGVAIPNGSTIDVGGLGIYPDK